MLGNHAAYLIIGVLTLIFAIAAYTGLTKGIKFLGTFRTWLFIGIWFFVLLLGPTLFLINLTIGATGQYVLNFLPMSLYTGIGDTTNWLGPGGKIHEDRGASAGHGRNDAHRRPPVGTASRRARRADRRAYPHLGRP